MKSKDDIKDPCPLCGKETRRFELPSGNYLKCDTVGCTIGRVCCYVSKDLSQELIRAVSEKLRAVARDPGDN